MHWVAGIADEVGRPGAGVPPRPVAVRAPARRTVHRRGRRAVQHLGHLRRLGHHEGLPQGVTRAQPRHRGPLRARRCRQRPHRPAAGLGRGHLGGPGGDRGDREPRHGPGVPQGRHGGVGAGTDQRARPVRRGRPARGRGRRRLRRRGRAVGYGHGRGAPRAGRCAADRDLGGQGARRTGRRHEVPAGPDRRGGRRARALRPGAAGSVRRCGGAHRAGRGAAGARRLPPRAGDADADRVEAARLRGRAGAAARRAPYPRVAGQGRRRDAALVRLRGPSPARRPSRRPSARVPRRGVGGAEPGRVLRGVRPRGWRRPAQPGGAAAGVRDRQGGLRGLYEARNRPTWLQIPMAAIRRLAAAEE